MRPKKTHETENFDSLKIEFRCISEAPRYSEVRDWASERLAYYWGSTGGDKKDYFLVRNPALMTWQCTNGADSILREEPIPVIFTGGKKKRQSTDWPSGAKEIGI